jgi:hypothetical protein
MRAVAKMTMPGGVEALNVYHARNDGALTETDPVIISAWESYLDVIYNAYGANVHNAITIDEYEIFTVDTVPVPPVLVPVGVGTPTATFTNVGPMLPQLVAALLSSDLDGAGRGNAKKFLPGLVETAQIDGIWIAGVQVTLDVAAVAYSALFGPLLAFTPVSWTAAKGARLFVTTVARDEVSVQRRRKVGVGT